MHDLDELSIETTGEMSLLRPGKPSTIFIGTPSAPPAAKRGSLRYGRCCDDLHDEEDGRDSKLVTLADIVFVTIASLHGGAMSGMKRKVVSALVAFLAGSAVAGCQGPPDDKPEQYPFKVSHRIARPLGKEQAAQLANLGLREQWHR